jgi:hypothetical protein
LNLPSPNLCWEREKNAVMELIFPRFFLLPA